MKSTPHLNTSTPPHTRTITEVRNLRLSTRSRSQPTIAFERLTVPLATDSTSGIQMSRQCLPDRDRSLEHPGAHRRPLTDGGTLGLTQMRLPWSPFQSTRRCFLRMASARLDVDTLKVKPEVQLQRLQMSTRAKAGRDGEAPLHVAPTLGFPGSSKC